MLQMANKIDYNKIITHECNILSNLLNSIKRAKSKNSHHSPILKGCMNTRSGRGEFINYMILFYSGRRSTIVMGNLISKIKQKISPKITTWETQAGNFTTSQKVNVDFYLPEFITTKIVLWKCNVDKKNNSRFDMILGRDLLTALVLDIKFS